MTDDKYPAESGRRRFVKGVLGGGTIAAVGTGAASAVTVGTAPTGSGGGIRTYVGIENVRGPAPRSMPQVPLTVDDDGLLRGIWPESESHTTADGRVVHVASMEIAGVTYDSAWFQYCGVQSRPALRPAADRDPFLRSAPTTPYDWQRTSLEPGDRLAVDDFADYETWGNDVGRAGLGKPAQATWRSAGAEPGGGLPVQILRSDRIAALAAGGHPLSDWLAATTHDGIVAWLDRCTHFCCVPLFKSYQSSEKFGAEDLVFCTCHQSAYDPFNPVTDAFVALPRPE